MISRARNLPVIVSKASAASLRWNRRLHTTSTWQHPQRPQALGTVFTAAAQSKHRRHSKSLLRFSTGDFSRVGALRDDQTNIAKKETEWIDDLETYPVGSLSQDRLANAESALELWVQDRSQEGFEKASAILMRLVQEQQFQQCNRGDQEDHDDYTLRPFLLNHVIDCWRTCWRDGLSTVPPSKMLEIVHDLESRSVETDSRTFTMIIDGMILRGNRFEAPLLAQWLLDKRMEVAERDESKRPDSVFFTNVIRAWSKSGRLEAPEMAQSLLQLMEDLFHNGWDNCSPNAISYAMTMEAFHRSKRRDRVVVLEKLLEDMKHSPIDAVNPTHVTYAYVISAMAHSPGTSWIQKANDLLQEMLTEYEAGNDDLTPNVNLFTDVMRGFARNGDLQAVEYLMRQLEDQYARTADPRFLTNDNCLKALIIALTQRGDPAQAERILSDLVEKGLSDDKPEATVPKRSYFIDVMVAWTKVKQKENGAEKAESILNWLLTLSSQGCTHLTPDSKCFEKVLEQWAAVRSEASIQKIQSLIERMDDEHRRTGNDRLRPTTKVIELALVALSRSGNSHAPHRATSFVKEVEHRHSQDDSAMVPTRGMYTSLMLTWQRSNEKESHHVVETLFTDLSNRWKQKGEEHLRPDAHIYGIVMTSWAEQGKPTQTQRVFDDMIDDFKNGNVGAKPDIHAFNKILRAWAFSRDKDKATSAEAAFQRLQEHESIYSVKLTPNRQTFNEMIAVWASSKSAMSAEMAEFYLRELQRQLFEPTVISYRAVIDAWSRSRDPTASVRAGVVLEELLVGVSKKQIRLPLPKPYRKFLKSVATSKIPVRSSQAQEILTSGSKAVHPLLLPSEIV